MDAFDDQNEFPPEDMNPMDESLDPAADFLAREQEELGDLGEELGLQQQNVTVNIEGLSLEDREELDAVNREVAAQRTSATPSPAFVMPPRPKEEPETIKQWRIDQAKRLEEKDAKEKEMMSKLKAEAEQELKDW